MKRPSWQQHGSRVLLRSNPQQCLSVSQPAIMCVRVYAAGSVTHGWWTPTGQPSPSSGYPSPSTLPQPSTDLTAPAWHSPQTGKFWPLSGLFQRRWQRLHWWSDVVRLHECLDGVVVVCADVGVVCAGVKVLHARVSGVSFCAGVQVLSLYMSLQCCCLCRCWVLSL